MAYFWRQDIKLDSDRPCGIKGTAAESSDRVKYRMMLSQSSVMTELTSLSFLRTKEGERSNHSLLIVEKNKLLRCPGSNPYTVEILLETLFLGNMVCKKS